MTLSRSEETLRWSVRLVDEGRDRRPVVFAAALLAGTVGWLGFGRPLFALLGAMMVLGATADYWLGSRFELDENGATARTGPSVTTMAWSAVRRVLLRGREVRLSPFEAESKLDAFRGVGLVTTPANRDEVVAFVRARLGEGVPVVDA